jgi:hypothetical protein
LLLKAPSPARKKLWDVSNLSTTGGRKLVRKFFTLLSLAITSLSLQPFIIMSNVPSKKAKKIATIKGPLLAKLETLKAEEKEVTARVKDLKEGKFSCVCSHHPRFGGWQPI